MGNKCNCVSTQSTDEAEDALLASGDHQTPREPPPPYQVSHCCEHSGTRCPCCEHHDSCAAVCVLSLLAPESVDAIKVQSE